MPPTFKGLLFRLPAGTGPSLAAAGTGLGLAGASFDVEPLFITHGAGVALVGGGREWYIARPTKSTTGAHAWDMAHEAHAKLSSGRGVAAGFMPDFVEP